MGLAQLKAFGAGARLQDLVALVAEKHTDEHAYLLLIFNKQNCARDFRHLLYPCAESDAALMKLFQLFSPKTGITMTIEKRLRG